MAETRRRGAVLEDAILAAGWAQLSEHGFAGFNVEAVAERARTGKAALYRRWPDRESLLMAVLAHGGLGAPRVVPDTGSLRGDVIGLLRSVNRFGDDIAALLSTVLGAYFDEINVTPAQLRVRLLGDRDLAMERILERAVERGEIDVRPPARIATLAVDLFGHELLMNLSRVPESTIIDIVDNVFLPFVTSPAGAGRD